MNAINFIQQHGVEKAREVVDGAPARANWYQVKGEYSNDLYSCNHELYGEAIMLSDLKRLAESVELVKEHHTLDRAIEYANSQYTAPEIKVCLLDAIADYRSIYGGEHV